MIASRIRQRPRVRLGRWRSKALLAVATAAGLVPALLTGAGPAQAATNPLPAAGITPAVTHVVTSTASNEIVSYVTGTGSVWVENLTTGTSFSAGGHLIAAPSVIPSGSNLLIFGRGTDNGLWMTTVSLTGTSPGWTSLGGTITSKPGAVAQGTGAADYSVYARGTDGAVWYRTHTVSGWGAWHSLGGKLYSGTGPSAAYLDGTYVLVTGTNRELYIAEAGVTGFHPAGGLTTASPGLAAIPKTGSAPAMLVGVARGTNNAGYYHRFLASSPGWHSMGGKFSSGLAVTTVPTAAETESAGLGTNSRIYASAQSWAVYPPAVGPWALVP